MKNIIFAAHFKFIIMQKIIPVVVALLFSCSLSARQVWCMLTDKGDEIPMYSIDYLLPSDTEAAFTVVLKDGSRVLDVEKATFRLSQLSTEVQKTVSETVSLYPNPVSHTLFLSGYEDRQVQLVALNGSVIKEIRITQQEQGIDVKDLPAGIYILRSPHNSIQFVKQ